MSQTDPYVTLTPRKMTREELVRVIRQDIAAELDAINLYQAHIDATDDERAKRVLAHIRDEEKVHVGELLALLKELDPDQTTFLEEGLAEVAPLIRKDND